MILGPRQCGKTKLARHFLRGTYLDLEKPSDYQVFAGDVELGLSRLDEPLILDEAQVIPQLFSILRSIIDQKREWNGRFYLLSSVNPALVRQVSESRADASGLKAGLNDGIIARGNVVYLGTRHYPLDDRIEVLPAEAMLGEPV